MSYFIVWTLKRGIVSPPEPVDAVTQFILDQPHRQASLDRDSCLTQEQWWREEGIRAGYSKRKVS